MTFITIVLPIYPSIHPLILYNNRLIIEKELYNETSFRKRMFDIRVVEERSKFMGTQAEWGDLFVELLMQAGM